MRDDQPDFVVLGHISRPHGVHGAVVVTPYAQEPDLILQGRHLELISPDDRRRPLDSLKGKEAAQGLIVKIKDVTTREAAAALKGWRVIMKREHLPPTADDEVYWADLIGLEVFSPDGRNLGRVDKLMEVGAGLILVVKRPDDPEGELLLPYQEEFLVELDLESGRLVLDPPPGLLEL